jgi:organic hydroperoxide reductase OsmC/OhrA
MGEEAPTVYRARLSWDGGADTSHTIELNEQRLAAATAAEFGGDPGRANPEVMFVASLSSCHMLWFLALARVKRLNVTSYEDEPEGTMDGTRFVHVTLRPRVTFEPDPSPEQIERLHRRSHERCFIANSVNCPVEIEPR